MGTDSVDNTTEGFENMIQGQDALRYRCILHVAHKGLLPSWQHLGLQYPVEGPSCLHCKRLA